MNNAMAPWDGAVGACPPPMAWATCARCGRPGCNGGCPATCYSCGLGFVGAMPVPFVGLGQAGDGTATTPVENQVKALACQTARRYGVAYAVEGKYADPDAALEAMFAEFKQAMPQFAGKVDEIKASPDYAVIKACFVEGFNSAAGPFYKQPTGKKGLLWGAAGGLLLGGVIGFLIAR